MSERLPRVVEPILKDYVALLSEHLPGLVEAIYLHGSIALNAFDEALSDIDFITVLGRRATDEDIEKLTRIHENLNVKHPKYMLDGSYLQWRDLGRLADEIEPHPYYHDNALVAAGHHEENSITWWVLKHHGVTLMGPEPQDLDFEVDWDLLITKMVANLNTYWVGWTKNPRRLAGLMTDYGVQWTVLGICRLLYTFQEGDITSKVGAGEYALGKLPAKWRPLIQEAIDIRRGSNVSHYRSRIGRAKAAVSFLKYVIGVCNHR